MTEPRAGDAACRNRPNEVHFDFAVPVAGDDPHWYSAGQWLAALG